jgi:hypothetical protein
MFVVSILYLPERQGLQGLELGAVVDKPFGRPDREALAPDLNILDTEHALVKILLLHGQALAPDLNILDTEHALVKILLLHGQAFAPDLNIPDTEHAPVEIL